MQLNTPVPYIKRLIQEGCTSEDIIRVSKWASDDRSEDIKLGDLSPAELDSLEAMFVADGLNTGVRKIQHFKKICVNPTGATVSRLETLEIALKEWLGGTPNKWLFCEQNDGVMVPYFVEDIRFEKASKRDQRPASVRVKMRATLRGGDANESLAFEHGDLKGKHTVEALMNKKGYYLETPDLVKDYEEQLARVTDIRDKVGEQFAATGQSFAQGKYHRSMLAVVSMVRDGTAAKVVMDDPFDEDSKGDAAPCRTGSRANASYTLWAEWAKQKEKGKIGGSTPKKEELDLDDDEMSVVVPVQPYVKVYDLGKHRFCLIHVNNLKAWNYEVGLIDKLVLPDDIKDLVTILIESADDLLEDIVRGKTGGIIVTSTGEPGVGKTLTAEVFSEEMQRPLYVVQCSQLGTDETELESRLDTVLARATRWKAILLLDEADVYVHERGEDIHQNAIVGVFLRVLEHYRGVLFMTSNRDVIIDDAILSRSTAHIRYAIPDTDAKLTEVWRILSTQFQTPIDSPLMAKLLQAFPPGVLSPRNIKNMLKLARTLNRKRAHVIDLALFQRVAKFIDLAHPERMPLPPS